PGLHVAITRGRTLVMARTWSVSESATSLHGRGLVRGGRPKAYRRTTPWVCRALAGLSAWNLLRAQGDTLRLRRDVLPWAGMFLAFQAGLKSNLTSDIQARSASKCVLDGGRNSLARASCLYFRASDPSATLCGPLTPDT
ncbi:MAG: hypothetical protein NXI32_15575, partial [bacterium]|nr:hypothetical protein [bacterium]